jgi:hypothetical protein
MFGYRPFWAMAVLLGCPACTTAQQSIALTTNPPGASCDVRRSGKVILDNQTTPTTVTVEPSLANILIVCRKEGYETVARRNEPQKDGMLVPPPDPVILLGSIVGLPYTYERLVHIDLAPIPPGTREVDEVRRDPIPTLVVPPPAADIE